METSGEKELREFHRYLTEKLSSGGGDASPEEALDEWRQCHPEMDAADENLAAIREALDDMDRGDRGIPFAQFDRDFRSRHNLSSEL